ncbi:MAG: PfkB family carbohydrate kinase [Kiritimatiellaeota bacterium]|nr:PfkB family carbohydrate kinase [Kiritimatiellota bacterium]
MTIKSDRVKQLLQLFPRQRIAVVGDLMLDRYIYGTVSRISPEAPVPVLHVTREKSMPGGASNVAWNVLALGGQTALCGLLGRDSAGRELREILVKGGMQADGVLDFPHLRTTVKTRIIAERQQVVRVDWEDQLRLDEITLDAFCRRVAVEVKKSTGVILEDYGKGVLQQRVADAALAAARAAGIPSGLDPKDDSLQMAGLTVATPNRREAFAAAGVPETAPGADPLRDAELLRVGAILVKKWTPRLLMVTLGPQGMLLLSGNEPPRHVPTRAREVFDVSGAGDTVIATCVLALAAGAEFGEAAEIANYAAGVVVGKMGTATCSPAELLEALAAD